MAEPLQGRIPWRYSVAELWADGVVHAVGCTAALAASVFLLIVFANGAVAAGRVAAVSVYLGTLLLSLGFSAAYNIWPDRPVKWWLRRLDHSAIYLLIAGTYTPFLAALKMWPLLLGVWLAAAGGVVLKLVAPGRFDRPAIVLFLALGWSGVAIFRVLAIELPTPVVALIVAGGATYSLGVVFHVMERRFCNAIWHGFVLVGAGIHFGAVALLALA